MEPKRNNFISKWDIRFLALAKAVAGWSKDPSTKCGAVIVLGNRVISMGYNGFARGVDDNALRYNDRGFKYPAVIHAEENAIIFARQNIDNCSIYTWPVPPCARCAAKIIQVGITQVIAIKPSRDYMSRWGEDSKIANEMYEDVGMYFHCVDGLHE